MVNKQYKIKHTVDHNTKSTKSTPRTPANYIYYFGDNSQPSQPVHLARTSSFTSYESIEHNTSDPDFRFAVTAKRNSLSGTNYFPDSEDKFLSTNPSSIETVYGKNITMSFDSQSFKDTSSAAAQNNQQKYASRRRKDSDQFDKNDAAINDIGRFQYILQMDKELGTYPESYYHLSPQSHHTHTGQPTSLSHSDIKSLSLNSSNGPSSINQFWKADADSNYPITLTTTRSSSMSSKPLQFRNRASEMFYWRKHELRQNTRAFCRNAKWPLLLLLACLALSCLIFVIFLAGANVTRNTAERDQLNDRIMSANFSDETISLTDFDVGEVDEQLLDNDFNYDSKYNHEKDTDTEDILTIYMKANSLPNAGNKNTVILTEQTKSRNRDDGKLQEIDFEVDSISADGDEHKKVDFEEKIKLLRPGSNAGQAIEVSTTRQPLSRNTQIIKYATKKGYIPDEEIFAPSTTETLNRNNSETSSGEDNTKLLPVFSPTKETVQLIGFTSGHQNNFGVPIEEDERILRLLNDQIIKHQNEETSTELSKTPGQTTTTTTVKVSPTLPIIIHHKDTSPSRFRTTTESMSMMNATDVCESTSLDLCQGVLRYDLTTTKSKRKLKSMDLEHFKYLIASRCSNRAAEFICSVLEPECRSANLGSLQPCKRICKSILEPCAGLISSSEILTMTFDCDRYPDSSDRNVCEDPTRRESTCYDNEYQCLDSTCIPKQWKCDNIKDCSLGEDEESCSQCHHDEFECHADGKCIADKWHCDGYNDCSDASDELDCDDYDYLNEDLNDEENFDDDADSNEYDPNDFLSLTEPANETTDLPDNLPFLTLSAGDADSNGTHLRYGKNEGLFGRDDVEGVAKSVNNRTLASNENESDDEIQTGEESGRVVVGVPNSQALGNFHESKEIMMTSDSENDFKYSKIVRSSSRTRNTTPATTTTTTSSNKKTSNSGSSTTRTTRLTTLLRRGTSTAKTTSEPVSQKLARTSSVKTTTKTSNKTTLPTTVPKHIQDDASLCPGAQLRCVSGKCITVDQLCDKIIDCPDGSDEARCVYKEDPDK